MADIDSAIENCLEKIKNAAFIQIHKLIFQEPKLVNQVWVQTESSKFDSVPTRFQMNHAETAFTCCSRNEVGLANLPQKFAPLVVEPKIELQYIRIRNKQESVLQVEFSRLNTNFVIALIANEGKET